MSNLLELADRFFQAIENNDAKLVEDLYSPEVQIWHNYDPIDAISDQSLCQTLADNLKLISALPGLIENFHYEVWHQSPTDSGFVRQHFVCGRTPQGEPIKFPVCVVGEVQNGRISKFYEYLDTTHLPQSVINYFAG